MQLTLAWRASVILRSNQVSSPRMDPIVERTTDSGDGSDALFYDCIWWETFPILEKLEGEGFQAKANNVHP